MKRILYVLVFLMVNGILSAQVDSFFVEVSRDTILAGNIATIKFVASNLDGEIDVPDMSNLNVVSGPNVSKSSTFFNGKGSSETQYSYVIRFNEIGEFKIPPAYLNTYNGEYETEPLQILVLPNPDGIIQDDVQQGRSSFFNFDFNYPDALPRQQKEEPKDKKVKRKLKRI